MVFLAKSAFGLVALLAKMVLFGAEVAGAIKVHVKSSAAGFASLQVIAGFAVFNALSALVLDETETGGALVTGGGRLAYITI